MLYQTVAWVLSADSTGDLLLEEEAPLFSKIAEKLMHIFHQNLIFELHTIRGYIVKMCILSPYSHHKTGLNPPVWPRNTGDYSGS